VKERNAVIGLSYNDGPEWEGWRSGLKRKLERGRGECQAAVGVYSTRRYR
jgi:hypothetical protein